MRWEALFADLEAQAVAADRAERAGAVDERLRLELAGLALADRLRASLGVAVRADLAGGHVCSGRLLRVGPDWLLLGGDQQEAVVPLDAVLAVHGLGRGISAAAPGAVEARLGLAHAVRGIARDRSGVRLLLRDGRSLGGTLDRAGADFVEFASHPAGEARRPAAVREVVVVAYSAIAAVCRTP